MTHSEKWKPGAVLKTHLAPSAVPLTLQKRETGCFIPTFIIHEYRARVRKKTDECTSKTLPHSTTRRACRRNMLMRCAASRGFFDGSKNQDTNQDIQPAQQHSTIMDLSCAALNEKAGTQAKKTRKYRVCVRTCAQSTKQRHDDPLPELLLQLT